MEVAPHVLFWNGMNLYVMGSNNTGLHCAPVTRQDELQISPVTFWEET